MKYEVVKVKPGENLGTLMARRGIVDFLVVSFTAGEKYTTYEVAFK